MVCDNASLSPRRSVKSDAGPSLRSHSKCSISWVNTTQLPFFISHPPFLGSGFSVLRTIANPRPHTLGPRTHRNGPLDSSAVPSTTRQRSLTSLRVPRGVSSPPQAASWRGAALTGACISCLGQSLSLTVPILPKRQALETACCLDHIVSVQTQVNHPSTLSTFALVHSGHIRW